MELKGKIQSVMNDERFWEYMAEEIDANTDFLKGISSTSEKIEKVKEVFSSMPDDAITSLFEKVLQRMK